MGKDLHGDGAVQHRYRSVAIRPHISPKRPRHHTWRALTSIVMLAGVVAGPLTANGPAAAASVARSAAEQPAAETPPTPALAPITPGASGYFEYTLTPRQSVEGSVRIRNPGVMTATFVLYATDASTSTATGVIYGGLTDTLTATGRWISLAASHITLGAGEAQTVPFRLAVPLGTSPGDYVAGFSAENPQASAQAPTANRIGVALTVNTRVVVAVVIHVPGDAPVALRLGTPTITARNGTQQVVTLPIADTGGTLVKPDLSVTVTRCANDSALATLNRHLDTVVPHTTIAYTWPLGQLVLSAGCYRVSETLSYLDSVVASTSAEIRVADADTRVTPASGPAKKQPTGSPHASIPPPALVALIAALLVMGCLLTITLVRGHRSGLRRRQLEGELARLRGPH